MPISVKADTIKLIRDSGSLVALEDAAGTVAYFTRCAVAPHEEIYPAGAMGHRYITDDREEDIIDFPMKLVRTGELGDFIVGALKVRGEVEYYFGVPAEKVKNWARPSDLASWEPDTIWQSLKVNLPSNEELLPLEDTATAKLATNFMDIVRCTTLFGAFKDATLEKMHK